MTDIKSFEDGSFAASTDIHPVALDIACRHDLECSTAAYQGLTLEMVSLAAEQLRTLVETIFADNAVSLSSVNTIKDVKLKLDDALYLAALSPTKATVATISDFSDMTVRTPQRKTNDTSAGRRAGRAVPTSGR